MDAVIPIVTDGGGSARFKGLLEFEASFLILRGKSLSRWYADCWRREAGTINELRAVTRKLQLPSGRVCPNLPLIVKMSRLEHCDDLCSDCVRFPRMRAVPSRKQRA
jgi:hypothetical protein